MAKPSAKHAGHPALVSLGKGIRAIRLEQNLSQENLAYGANLDRSYVGGIERGEHNITLLNLQKIAEQLGINTSDLLKRAGL